LKEILFITPPFTQLNTPYPATAYLKGFLNTRGISSYQMDLGIEVILELFSNKRLQHLFDHAFQENKIKTENAKRIYALKEDYLRTIDNIITFLQGHNETFARQICTKGILPHASRFDQLEDLEQAFGWMGIQDKAKYLSTLYLEDLSDFIVDCIDEDFGVSRYAERLGQSANSFDELYEYLQKEKTFIDVLTLEILDKKLKSIQPVLVGLSVPFPGNLYSAFRCAQHIRKKYPEIKITMGGGFPTTELRSLSDKRVFEYFDFITLDDGELPIELLFDHVKTSKSKITEPTNTTPALKRTYLLQEEELVYNNSSFQKDYKQHELGTPDYSDLLLDKYISVIEVTNPMHSLWSDGRWNKLTMAHGCYWGKCAFCDCSLSYIKDFEPISAKLLVDRMEQLIAATGERGFHFVDEAAPPALMKALAIEILKRKLTLSWWTNIRFEKSYTKDLCQLLKASGCIAVSGGLEVASDRMLKLINKGVTIEQVARVGNNLTEAGIMVHAYLMYGFPSETVQETIDSLETVRQFFKAGIIQSAYWHQFALTAHSPVGLNPTQYGIVPAYNTITFANNDIQFRDKTGIDHDKFSYGLKKSLFNYMHNIGFELHLQDWFNFKIPKTSIRRDYIDTCLTSNINIIVAPASQIVWMGGSAFCENFTKSKKGNTWAMTQLTFHDKTEIYKIAIEQEKGEWLEKILKKLTIGENDLLTFELIKNDFEMHFNDFELFWYSKPIDKLRKHGLLVL
jgi:radical SAM superfamily enzyme YgiQ (UPF0313 family)